MRLRVFVLIVTLGCFSCGGDRQPRGGEPPQDTPERVATDSTRIGAYTMTVASDADRCFLDVAGPLETRRLALAPAPPCHFLRRGSDAPQSFAYPDEGIQAVLIVAGTPIDDATRSRWGLPDNLVCGAEAQGVLLTQEGVRLSGQVLEERVACRDKGLDEKDFWSLAHEDGTGAVD